MGQIYKGSLAKVCSPLRDHSPGWINSCGGRQLVSVAVFQRLMVVSTGTHCSGARQIQVTIMCSEGIPDVWLHILASHIVVVLTFDCLQGGVWAPLF